MAATGSSRPLRVVMALENNPYPQDGRVRREAEELAADGHEVLVLAPRAAGQPRNETLGGVRVSRIRVPERRGVTGILLEYTVAVVQLSLRLVAELMRGADVLHFHNPPDLLFPVGALARVMGRAVVFDHHDLAPELFEEKYRGRWAAAILRWCERMTVSVATVVIATNESYRRVAIDRDGKAANRVIVVRNAPGEEMIASAPFTRPGVLDSPRLCYVGSLDLQDGVSQLPEIVARLCGLGLQPTLAIVGDGPERETIARLAREQGVSGHIELTGFVSPDDVPRFIDAADICLDVALGTPLNHKSTMVKIGEYLAGGRPVVTFALDETRYTADGCAVIVEHDDLDSFCCAVVELCRDEQLRASLSERALERAREISWDKSAANLRLAYAIVGASPPVAAVAPDGSFAAR
jgi:glycosyltransferase involved in cell wall biosynthesis